MRPETICGALSVILLMGAVYSAGPAAEKMEAFLKDNYSDGSYETMVVTFGQYTGQHFTWTFNVNRSYEILRVSQNLGAGSSMDPDESITAELLHPGQHKIAPWEVHVGECHNPRGCDFDVPFGEEWIMIVSPPMGTYDVIVTPGPGRNRLPDQQHLSNVLYGTQGFLVNGSFNVGDFRGDDIWWYMPDGSSTLVKDGGFIQPLEVTQSFILPGSLLVGAVGFGLTALILIRRNSRRKAPPQTDPNKTPSFAPGPGRAR